MESLPLGGRGFDNVSNSKKSRRDSYLPYAREDARNLSYTPHGKHFYLGYGKRIADVSVSLIMLMAVLPLLLCLVVLISCNGGRPIYRHPRVGRGGRTFDCLKLRTMTVDAEARLERLLASDVRAAAEWRKLRKLADDPRITRIGRFLRRTSLDELPQLWNVLKGDMSLVGPRPVTVEELEYYGQAADIYVTVRPGLTGPWQIGGRNSLSFEERVRIDVDYVMRLSGFRDIRILLKTPIAMIRATGQ